MSYSLVVADKQVDYGVKEAAVVVFALAFVIAVGGISLAAWIACGSRGVKNIDVNFWKGQAKFYCN